jgi:hypothetical protein
VVGNASCDCSRQRDQRLANLFFLVLQVSIFPTEIQKRHTEPIMLRGLAAIVLSLTFTVFVFGAPAPERDKSTRLIRVLLIAGSPTREYQFLRSLLVKESERKHVVLSILLQPPPGREKRREGVVQDVPPERLLETFPDKLDAYDAIVSFDPDWSRLTIESQKKLRGWVQKSGGTLVLIAGPINTKQLVGKAAQSRFAPLLDLFPVVLADTRRLEKDIDTSKPRRLRFPTTKASYPFLKLDTAGKERLAGWREFFEGKNTGETGNGFYSFYPVESVKSQGVVLAALDDEKVKMKDGKEQPYLIIGEAEKGRVVYLGSGEIWRLLPYRRAYYERFWLTLLRDKTEPRP